MRNNAIRLLALLGLLWFARCGMGYGAVAYAGIECANNPSSGASVSCTLSGVPAGSTIYIDAYWENGVMQTSMTDSNGSPVKIIGPTQWTDPSRFDAVWRVANATAGTHVLTSNLSGSSTYPTIIAVVLTGASLTSPEDSIATPNVVSTCAPCSSNTVTTSAANEFLLVFALPTAVGTATAGTTPQVMTAITTSYTNIIAEYGTAVVAGSNYAEITVPSSTAEGTDVELIAVRSGTVSNPAPISDAFWFSLN